jgi:cytochrome c-type protein NapB
MRGTPEEAPGAGEGGLIEGAQQKLFAIGGAVAIAAAGVGFFTGTRQPSAERAGTVTLAPHASERAPSYAEMRTGRRGANANMYEGAFDELAQGGPGLYDPIQPTDEDRAQALAARAQRRAYDGAPPTIPHAVLQMGPPACLACHEHGARLGGKVAPRPSHQRHEGCTQCHVVSVDPRPGQPARPPPANDFVGLSSPARGERAWPGAPPTIPHSTWMRSVCTSCHGVGGALGLRSTHPWRQSCTQCHAPSAILDQRPMAAAGGTP